jgi:uncharacterized membrane protein (UPF0127 family)
MNMKVIIRYKRKKISVNARKCNILGKTIGLMFSRREKAKILLFKFKKKQKIKIHSMFVFYKFIAVWLDEKNNVVDLKIVKPFLPCISHKKTALSLVEIPINNHYSRIANSFF